MTDRLLFIYNPVSGKGKIVPHVEEITGLFRQAGYTVDCCATGASLDARNKVRREAAGYDRVICAGGDGTLSEVVSGMMESGAGIPIGFIPVGTTNDTRAGFGLPKDILSAAQVCLSGVPFQADVGRFNEEYFTYVASFGSLSAVSCFTSQEMKRIFGHGAYLIEGIRQLIRMESCEMTVEFDGQKLEGEFFLGMITNSVTVGGFEGITGGHVDLQDGLFEAALLRKPANLLEFAREIDRMLIHNKEDREILDDVVVRFKTNRAVCKTDVPVQWVRDGEDGGKHREAAIQVCRKAVTILSTPSANPETY